MASSRIERLATPRYLHDSESGLKVNIQSAGRFFAALPFSFINNPPSFKIIKPFLN